MRTRAVLTSVFASLGVLTVGLQVGASALPQPTTTTSTGDTAGSSPATTAPQGTTTSSAGAAAGTTSATTTSAKRSITDGTFTGNDVNTRFGSVQVSVTVAGGSISSVTALQLTDADGRSRQISNYAAPILASEVVSAQSANVRNVSGATYTTNAYLNSVQSALDQAGF